jgi:hypothetical protein
MTRIRTAGVLLALLALVGLAPAAGASGSGQDVPIKGTVSGQVQFLPATDCPSGFATTMVDVPGVTSHLGLMTWSSRHCAPMGDAFGPGTMTWVAANGDELFMAYSGSAPFPGPGVDVIEGESHATIVGGTGRFEDAEGYVDTTFTLQFEGFGDPSWPGVWVSTGMIHY